MYSGVPAAPIAMTTKQTTHLLATDLFLFSYRKTMHQLVMTGVQSMLSITQDASWVK